jgi:hypothetical protein
VISIVFLLVVNSLNSGFSDHAGTLSLVSVSSSTAAAAVVVAAAVSHMEEVDSTSRRSNKHGNTILPTEGCSD